MWMFLYSNNVILCDNCCKKNSLIYTMHSVAIKIFCIVKKQTRLTQCYNYIHLQ